MNLPRSSVLIILSCALAATLLGCGGGGSNGGNNSGSSGGGSSNNNPGTTNPGGTLVTPTPIQVAAGQTASGIDIAVPAQSPGLNAQLLGVNPPTATTVTASNTGGSVSRGTSALVLIFGKGLSASNQVSFSGPNDITITELRAVKSSDGTMPGLLFRINVPTGAAPGARTVIIQDASSNVTTFTGGIEVQ